jgi:hypothetical protein
VMAQRGSLSTGSLLRHGQALQMMAHGVRWNDE